MRRRMIEALTYPRILVERIIEERACPNDGGFEAKSEWCHECEMNSECHWVSCLNKFSDFAEKPAYTINASLRYGIKLVESMHSELQHDETMCACEPCVWVRDTQRLIEEFEHDLAPNPYRPAH
jgi:hypothetical protein